MHITASAVSLNVENVTASSAFLSEHFGFRQDMAADGFVSLTRQDTGMDVAFHAGAWKCCLMTSATRTPPA